MNRFTMFMRRTMALLAVLGVSAAMLAFASQAASATPMAPASKSVQSVTMDMSAGLVDSVSQTAVSAVIAATTAYPTSSSVCGAENQYGTPCVRIVENGLGHVYVYGTFYEKSGRPSVASVTAYTDICGYGTNGTCRDLGSGYERSYAMTGVFGRSCSVDVAGGWSGIASGSCQIQGDNWNLTAGNLYQGVVTWRIVRYSDNLVSNYTVRTAWIQPKG